MISITLLNIFTGAILLIIFLSNATPRLYNEWLLNSNTEHVLLALPISLFLLYRELKHNISNKFWEIDIIIPFPSLLLFVISTILIYIDSLIIEESFLALAILLAITGLIRFFFSSQGFKNCLFPLTLLAFCVPLPETIARHVFHMHLQKLSAITSSGILSIFGYEATVTGAVIFIHKVIRLNVVEACSGLNAIISFFFISFLIAKYKFSKKRLCQIIIIMGSILSAFFSNVVRLIIAGVIAKEYGINTMDKFIHSWSILIIYTIGICIIMLLASMLKELCTLNYSMEK
jgi:exosortase